MKKIFAIILAVVLCLGVFAGCQPTTPQGTQGNNETQGNSQSLAGTYDAKVWVAENIVELTKQQIADFNADGIDDIVVRSAAGDLGVFVVNGPESTEWKYCSKLTLA